MTAPRLASRLPDRLCPRRDRKRDSSGPQCEPPGVQRRVRRCRPALCDGPLCFASLRASFSPVASTSQWELDSSEPRAPARIGQDRASSAYSRGPGYLERRAHKTRRRSAAPLVHVQSPEQPRLGRRRPALTWVTHPPSGSPLAGPSSCIGADSPATSVHEPVGHRCCHSSPFARPGCPAGWYAGARGCQLSASPFAWPLAAFGTRSQVGRRTVRLKLARSKNHV